MAVPPQARIGGREGKDCDGEMEQNTPPHPLFSPLPRNQKSSGFFPCENGEPEEEEGLLKKCLYFGEEE